MVKNKKITFKQNELVSFITETITEIYVDRLLSEQRDNSVTYLNIKLKEPVYTYKGTRASSLAVWASWPADVKNALQSLSIPIGPFSVVTQSYYSSLSSQLQNYLHGYLYPVNLKNEGNRNLAYAQGDATYMFIPSEMKAYKLPTVNICVDIQTGKKVDCDTRMAMDGTHSASGFEVDTSHVQVPSLFGYDEATMNTKYFCKKYILGDVPTPENVKPKVLMHLQRAYSNKTGENLGINSSKAPEYYYSGSNLAEKLGGYKDYDLLYLVSEYINASIDDQKERYIAGEWRYMVGTKLNPESQVPLTNAQHKRYFKEMKNFAAMLMKTNCGFGVGKASLTRAELQVREKYGDIFTFEAERPENWEEMSTSEKATWEDANQSESQTKSKLERQNDTQFWWDMISVAIIVVAVIITIASAGTLAPIAAGLVYLSVGMGVASAVFDMWQGEWGWGVTGLVLEALPFVKVIKMSKYLLKIPMSTKKFNAMVEFGLKNGKEALKPKYGKSGKALYEALSENADEVAKLVDANTKESIKFLKRFSTMDPSEFYALQMLNKGFKKSMKGIPFSKFDSGMRQLSDILFANRTAWRTLVGKARFSLSLPMKMIGLNLVGMTLVNTVKCFDFEVDIKDKGLLFLHALTSLYPAGAIISGLNMVEITLDTERTQTETMCTLFALIYANVSDKEVVSLERELNEVVDGNVTVRKEANNLKITIEQLNGSGEGQEVTVVDIEKVGQTVNNILDQRAAVIYRALIESYTDDEEILEYWLLELGGDQIGSNRLDKLLQGVNNDNRKDIDRLFDLISDTDKMFRNKLPEIKQRRAQKEEKYGL